MVRLARVLWAKTPLPLCRTVMCDKTTGSDVAIVTAGILATVDSYLPV